MPGDARPKRRRQAAQRREHSLTAFASLPSGGTPPSWPNEWWVGEVGDGKQVIGRGEKWWPCACTRMQYCVVETGVVSKMPMRLPSASTCSALCPIHPGTKAGKWHKKCLASPGILLPPLKTTWITPCVSVQVRTRQRQRGGGACSRASSLCACGVGQWGSLWVPSTWPTLWMIWACAGRGA